MRNANAMAAAVLASATLVGCGVRDAAPQAAQVAKPGIQQAARDRDQVVPDDTDDLVNGKESGMVLRTDHGTGCQYLMIAAAGVLTPRLGEDGKPLCNPQLKRRPR